MARSVTLGFRFWDMIKICLSLDPTRRLEWNMRAQWKTDRGFMDATLSSLLNRKDTLLS